MLRTSQRGKRLFKPNKQRKYPDREATEDQKIFICIPRQYKRAKDRGRETNAKTPERWRDQKTKRCDREGRDRWDWRKTGEEGRGGRKKDQGCVSDTVTHLLSAVLFICVRYIMTGQTTKTHTHNKWPQGRFHYWRPTF